MQKNRTLIAVVAAVALAAVATGGAVAYRQGPRADAEADAKPLGGLPTPAGPTTPTPSASTPSRTPSTSTVAVKPTPKPSGSVKTAVVLEKLPTGRVPQIPYLTGRTIRGGAGGDVKVPGSQDIHAIARLRQSVLAVVSAGDNTTEMLTLGSDGAIVRRTPNVTGIVTTEDGSAAAYNTTLTSDLGEDEAGTTVYAEQDTVQKVTVPGVWHATLLGYVKGKVYFQASGTQDGKTWTLYEWTPGAGKATALKTVPKPTAVSGDGTAAASLTALNDQHSCTSVLSIASGKRLWRTCEYQVDSFTQDGSTAIAGPIYRDGYGDGMAAALDAKTGRLLHEWSGVFLQTVAEDDQHLLIRADTGQETRAAIIRCTISTGACELATPLAKGNIMIGS
ncbi:hypothetical protein ACWCOV_36965 [Kribbella sp. NPDC002412]